LSKAGVYRASATALMRSVVRWIPPPELSEEPNGHQEALPWIADRLVCRHGRALQRFSLMCKQDVSRRILHSLVELSKWCPGADGLEASLPLSQSSLAQLVCSTRETVSTKLNRMAEDQLVYLAPRRIGIPSVERLCQILAATPEVER
jgi:CRP-like cAMP-binding protein